MVFCDGEDSVVLVVVLCASLGKFIKTSSTRILVEVFVGVRWLMYGVARNDKRFNIIWIRERDCIDDSRTAQPTK